MGGSLEFTSAYVGPLAQLTKQAEAMVRPRRMKDRTLTFFFMGVVVCFVLEIGCDQRVSYYWVLGRGGAPFRRSDLAVSA